METHLVGDWRASRRRLSAGRTAASREQVLGSRSDER